MNKMEIIGRIKELIPQAQPDWADVIADKMGKSVNAVYAYARGDRGVRKGYHKEVLAYLKEMVLEENERIEKLLS